MTLTDQVVFLKRLPRRLRQPLSREDDTAIREITANIIKLKMLAEASEEMKREKTDNE